MTNKHTPGPWIVETRKEMDIPSKYLIWAWEADRQLVASMVTREADANLIAAAPELLKGLEELLEKTEWSDVPEWVDDDIRNMLAAAKGK